MPEERKKLFVAVMVFTLLALIGWLIAPYITLDMLKNNRAALVAWVSRYYLASIIIYFTALTIVVACALPLVALLIIMGGMLFDLLTGGIIVISAVTLGAVISFLVIRFLFHEYMHVQYTKKFQTFYIAMKRHGAWYLLALHFATFIPISIANIVAAISPVTLWTFVWTTALGIIPTTILYLMTGKELNMLNTLTDLVSARVGFIIGFLVVLALSPVIIARLVARSPVQH